MAFSSWSSSDQSESSVIAWVLFKFALPFAPLPRGERIFPGVRGPLDTDGLERQAARGVAAGSCDRRLQDLDSLDGVRGGELGGSESGLEEVMAITPSFGVRWEKRREAEGGGDVD